MKNKRVIAKIVDTVIFIFFTMCTSTMFLFLGLSIMEIFGAELQALNTFIGMEPLEIVELIMDDTILYIQIMFFANLFLMLSAFVYFVIISSKLHGSPGKYLFHMSIAKKEDATSNFKLFLREPLVHMIIWTMVLNLIFILTGFALSIGVVSIVYIIILYRGYEFWNKNFIIFVNK